MRSALTVALVALACGCGSPERPDGPHVTVLEDGLAICVGDEVTITDQIGQNRIDVESVGCFTVTYFDMFAGDTLPCVDFRVTEGGCTGASPPEAGSATRAGMTLEATCTCHFEVGFPTPIPHDLELDVVADLPQ